MTLLLTSAAVEVIKGLAAARAADGVRILASPSLDAGDPGLQIELAAGPRPEETVVEAEEARIFLAPGALAAMNGRLLDADIEGGEVHFALLDQTDEEPG